MRITKIEKKKRFYLLELDSQENLYITEDTIVRFMLSRGKEISEKELVAIRDFAQFSYGKNLALYFLSFKQRTKKEVTDYLRKYEVDEVKSARILQVLEEEKWIDDRQYVESYLRQNVLSGDKGPAFIHQKLVAKGISKNMIETELAGFDFSDLAKRV
ncbi:RecX family transcriptional regulator, partial [Streptococcus ruminantium]|uniref:RecX family transcriptional regulator n=1 Tax=Streptococcus ruminantium TaxID=1917441 RepID=UPI001D14F23E